MKVKYIPKNSLVSEKIGAKYVESSLERSVFFQGSQVFFPKKVTWAQILTEVSRCLSKIGKAVVYEVAKGFQRQHSPHLRITRR